MFAFFCAYNILVANNNGLQPISDLQASFFSMALSKCHSNKNNSKTKLEIKLLVLNLSNDKNRTTKKGLI
jgi:hypothetical protein